MGKYLTEIFGITNMYIQNLCRTVIVIVLSFTLLLGTFTDNVMAANEPNLIGSNIQQLNAQSGKNEITQSTSKTLPSLQLGDGTSNGAQGAVFLLQKLLAGLHWLEKDSVNGEFSDKTEEAIKKYQKDKGIEQDGKVDQNIWSKLGDDILSKSLSKNLSINRVVIQGPRQDDIPFCPSEK